MTKHQNNLTSAIDELGLLKAEIAKLKARESELRDVITKQGQGTYVGTIYQASVSVGVRKTLDMESVRKHLSRQFICRNTNTTPFVKVQLSAMRS
tara:strand:+ start:1970 stop:2254 length:285 start_codon:yes stop_codon:yes gene_type:complete